MPDSSERKSEPQSETSPETAAKPGVTALSSAPPSEAQVEHQILAYVEKAPPTIRRQLFARLVHYSGPLPPPEMIAAYDAAVPGMGRDLLDSFLEEGKHRRALDTRQLDLLSEDARSRRSLDRRGMTIGAVVAILGLVGSVAAILMGHDVAGGLLGGTELTALVAIFVLGRSRKSETQGLDRKGAGDA